MADENSGAVVRRVLRGLGRSFVWRELKSEVLCLLMTVKMRAEMCLRLQCASPEVGSVVPTQRIA
jgi:hypothetical protein